MDNADVWLTREACAQEVGLIRGESVTPGRLLDWKRRNRMPLPTKGPISKSRVIDWLNGPDAPKVSRPAGDQKTDEENVLRLRYLQEQIRYLEAKNAVLEGTRLDAGQVKRGIQMAAADLQTEMLTDLPAKAWADIHDLPVDTWIDGLKTHLAAAINRHATKAAENIVSERQSLTAPQPADEAIPE